MKKLPTDTDVDIELFQDDLKDIDREFIPSIVSIFKISTHAREIGFLFITNNNTTYAYGDDICKWLSLKHDPKRPQQIGILNGKKIIQIDSGNEFVVVLTDDGLVYIASSEPRWQTNNTFRLISTGNDRFEMIACGQFHLLLLRQDGTVLAMGCNSKGQLTGNSDSSYKIFVKTGLKNVKIIACGFGHCFALTNKNKLYSWGWNCSGQLGLGNTFDRRKPSVVPFINGSINSPIKNIIAGPYHSLFLLEDGQIFGCGLGQRHINDNKQDSKMATKIPIENVQSVACKNNLDLSFAMDKSYNYYVWGHGVNKLSPEKLNGQLESFVAASILLLESPITFGLTTIDTCDLKSNNQLFNNPDNYDVKFVIDDKPILASKCYLKMASKYYSQMFSGDWKNTDSVVINDYGYDTYYSYLRMLHDDYIRIKQSNIAELIDLANCYGDERLMKLCRTFIQTDLNKQTLFTYYPLIDKYEIDEMQDKLVQLTIKDVLPKITNNLIKNKNIIYKFLELVSSEQQSFLTEE